MLPPLFGLLEHRWLIWRMARREVAGRYRGSQLGLLWSLATPLLLLAVYTFVFGSIFRSRWSDAGSGSGPVWGFALILFAGMIPFNLFAEVATRAPALIVNNPNYVKKVVFPLPVLSWVNVLAALFHAAVSLVALLLTQLVVEGRLAPTLWLLPLVWLPLCLLLLGLSLWLSSLAVFVRDIGQVVGMAVTILMFLSPLFYPASSLPAWVAGWIWLNPLVFLIEATRQVVLWGQIPAWNTLLAYTVGAWAFAASGYLWFNKSRNGFADVL